MAGRDRYDEQLLVELMAEGSLSQKEIARRVGVTQTTISRIATGRSRPDLYKRICTLRGPTERDKAMHTGSDYIRALLLTQLKVAMDQQGETARKCREYLLNKLLFTGKKPGPRPGGGPEIDDEALTLAEIQRELAEIAGPGFEPEAPAEEPDV
jgi:transcriptional regulator with XRE-family HTH domain